LLNYPSTSVAPKHRKSGALRAMKRSFSPLQSRTAASALFFAVMITPVMAQTNLEPRLPGIKLNFLQLLAMPPTNRVVIKFREGSRISLRNGLLVDTVTAQVNFVQNFIRQLGILTPLHRLFGGLAEEQLNAQREEAQRISGRALANLNLYFVLPIPPGILAAQIAAQLNTLPDIEFADLAPVPFPAPAGSNTPDFSNDQLYKNLPPQGIGVLDPVKAPGSDGNGMTFADVEYSWQQDHEDLNIPNVPVLSSGTPLDYYHNTDHGTAVLGEIIGLKNSYGITGIAPAAKVKLAPTYTQENGYDPANAIFMAYNALQPGDVIVVEQQYPVCGRAECDGTTQGGCGPLEGGKKQFHDAIANATALGRIVVEAAGNGNVNLDDAETCKKDFDRATNDSGAIIVGAGNPTSHARMGFSSYGMRLDVQGWGDQVTTTGYGAAFNPGPIQRRYTRSFDGTSSATPIVAAAILAIQGRLKACHLPLATPAQMRQALTTTGTPQPASDPGHIGPLPQIAAALSALGADKCNAAAPP
jgi:serine protease